MTVKDLFLLDFGIQMEILYFYKNFKYYLQNNSDEIVFNKINEIIYVSPNTQRFCLDILIDEIHNELNGISPDTQIKEILKFNNKNSESKNSESKNSENDSECKNSENDSENINSENIYTKYFIELIKPLISSITNSIIIKLATFVYFAGNKNYFDDLLEISKSSSIEGKFLIIIAHEKCKKKKQQENKNTKEILKPNNNNEDLSIIEKDDEGEEEDDDDDVNFLMNNIKSKLTEISLDTKKVSKKSIYSNCLFKPRLPSSMDVFNIDSCISILLDSCNEKSSNFFIKNSIEIIKLKFNKKLFIQLLDSYRAFSESMARNIQIRNKANLLFCIDVNFGIEHSYDELLKLPLPYYFYKSLISYSPQFPVNCYTLKYFIDQILSRQEKYLEIIFGEFRKYYNVYSGKLSKIEESFFLLFSNLYTSFPSSTILYLYIAREIDFFVETFWSLDKITLNLIEETSISNFPINNTIETYSNLKVVEDYIEAQENIEAQGNIESINNDKCYELLKYKKYLDVDLKIAQYYLDCSRSKIFNILIRESDGVSDIKNNPKKLLMALLLSVTGRRKTRQEDPPTC